MTAADHTARCRGALVGVAVGDALGAPFEGMARVAAAALTRLVDDPGPMRYTDDTAMSIAMAVSLVERGGFDGAHMAATFADQFFAEPWRGYGGGPPQIFDRIRAGEPWDRPARALFGGSGSYGNGAAMRVAPVAVFGHPDTERVADLARRTAVITHAHPEGVDGAVAQAVAVALMLDEAPPSPERVLDGVRPHLTTTEFTDRLDAVAAAVDRGDDEYARATLGNGIAARDSVPTALYCALRHDSFAESVTSAVGMGGDADTIGAMAGALAGACHGVEAIPAAWRCVEGFARLVDLADATHAAGR
jgi:poly(ADP-ribose) glycohydrolase ARH3